MIMLSKVSLPASINRQSIKLVVLDSFGKPHSGMTKEGQIKWFGSYEECVETPTFNGSVRAPLGIVLSATYQPQYCQMLIKIPSTSFIL